MTNLFCWQAYAETSRSQWVKDWPGQVVLCTSQIYWTLEVHEAVQAGPNVGLLIITFHTYLLFIILYNSVSIILYYTMQCSHVDYKDLNKVQLNTCI